MTPDREPEIVADNVRAAGVAYSVWMLEQAGAFRVIDRIAELFMLGELPIGDGRAGRALHRFARAGDRLTAADRAGIYAQVLGVPGGESGTAGPNRDFMHLWLRFLAAVSDYAREHGAVRLLVPASVANETVRAAAHALAANASRYGAVAAPLMSRLVREAHDALGVLQHAELLRAFSVRSVWQLIDRVHREHLGRLSHVAQFHAQASASSVVFGWLAGHSAVFSGRVARGVGQRGDARLVEAVEALLATGSGDVPEAPPGAPMAHGSRREARLAAHELLRALDLSAEYDRGAAMHGLTVVFQGLPGTGKTLAAHVLAQALSMPLYRVDLATVAGKYIGETEKNLDALFERAQRAGALLLFDEADALFGRRSEVRDAHDRYASAVVDDLLRRIAAHEGPLLLTVGTEVNVDAAPAADAWRRRRWRVLRFPPRSD